MIKIQTESGEITLDKGVWTAYETGLADQLNAVDWSILLPPGYYPDLDYAYADLAAQMLDGEITDATPLPYDPEAIY